MTIDFSQLPLLIWIVVAVVIISVIVIVIRFFWQHVVKFALQGCAVILAIIALLFLLHYFKVF